MAFYCKVVKDNLVLPPDGCGFQADGILGINPSYETEKCAELPQQTES